MIPELLFKRLQAHHSQGLHRHQDAAFTFVLNGTLIEQLPGSTHYCERFSIQYKPAELEHTTRTSGNDVDMVVINLPPDATQGIEPVPQVAGPGITTAIGTLLADPTLSDLTQASTDRLKHWWPRQPSRNVPDWLLDAHDLLVRETLPVSGYLSHLAHQLSRHPVYVARTYRKYFGQSVGRTLRQRRLDHSARKLLFTDASIASIAVDVGYVDQSHMTRDVKAATGVTPGALRRSARRVGLT